MPLSREQKDQVRQLVAQELQDVLRAEFARLLAVQEVQGQADAGSRGRTRRPAKIGGGQGRFAAGAGGGGQTGSGAGGGGGGPAAHQPRRFSPAPEMAAMGWAGQQGSDQGGQQAYVQGGHQGMQGGFPAGGPGAWGIGPAMPLPTMAAQQGGQRGRTSGDGGQGAGGGQGGGGAQAGGATQGQRQSSPSAEEIARAVAHVLAQTQFELSKELEVNLLKLRQILVDTEALARKIERILGKNVRSDDQPR